MNNRKMGVNNGIGYNEKGSGGRPGIIAKKIRHNAWNKSGVEDILRTRKILLPAMVLFEVYYKSIQYNATLVHKDPEFEALIMVNQMKLPYKLKQ